MPSVGAPSPHADHRAAATLSECPPISSPACAAIHLYTASAGPSALQRATLELSPAAAPPPATPFGAPTGLHLVQPLQLGAGTCYGDMAGELAEGQGQRHWTLPSPLASHQMQTPTQRAPTPPDHHLHLAASEQLAAAAAEAARLQRQRQHEEQRQLADAAQWHSLQALLTCEPSFPPLGAPHDGLPLGGHAVPCCGGYAAGAADAADPLACMGMELTLACSLPVDTFFDTACLDLMR